MFNDLFPNFQITSSTVDQMETGSLNTPLLKFSGHPIGRTAWVEEILRKIEKKENDLKIREMQTKDIILK